MKSNEKVHIAALVIITLCLIIFAVNRNKKNDESGNMVTSNEVDVALKNIEGNIEAHNYYPKAWTKGQVTIELLQVEGYTTKYYYGTVTISN